MKYVLLIYGSEKEWAARPPEEHGQVYNEYMALTEAFQKSGQMTACEPLDPTSTATTLRVRDGIHATARAM
jgi:hypothetical protein